jgi:serine/threonine protein kinase
MSTNDVRPSALQPGQQFGRYQVRKKLGGMGAVYLVFNTQLHREEALKLPHLENTGDPQVIERFLREARAAAGLHHPNLCPVHDVGVLDSVCYLTMPYLEGKLLSGYCGRPLQPQEAVKIVVKLAETLAYAHGKGVIHRDLKPSNVHGRPARGERVVG